MERDQILTQLYEWNRAILDFYRRILEWVFDFSAMVRTQKVARSGLSARSYLEIA
jgi:hypothetical protein